MSSVTFWYTTERLEQSTTDTIYRIAQWCDKQIAYQIGTLKELEPQSPRLEAIELLEDTIEECQRILSERSKA